MKYAQGFMTAMTIVASLVISQYIYIGEMQGYQIHLYGLGFMIIAWCLGRLSS